MCSLPIQFIKGSESRYGNGGTISLLNAAANAAVVAVGGIALGGISYVALKALGFNGVAAGVMTAIPITIGAIGVVGSVVFIGFALVMTNGVSKR